jgi:ElaB/YqjD/DUF883 family membrane-anchored ribosome-binding protein
MGRKKKNSSDVFRDLSEKELNEIMRAVGDHARNQSSEQKNRGKENLRKTLKSAREAFLVHASIEKI